MARNESGSEAMWPTSDGAVERITVFAWASEDFAPAAQLILEGRNPGRRRSVFRYGRSWLSDPEAQPLALTGADKRKKAVRSDPWELPIWLYDALPDGWGRTVLARAYPGHTFGVTEFLVAADHDRTGHLAFGPDADGPAIWAPGTPAITIPVPGAAIEDIADAATAIDEGTATREQICILIHSGSGIGGARPKARITIDGDPWIAKFPARDDPFDHQIAEFACLDLARRSGLDVPEHRLLEIGSRRILAVKRFDREAGDRLAYSSAATLVGQPPHAYNAPGWSYPALVQQAQAAGVRGHAAEMFGRMLVNVIVNNTDDHLRNHAYIRRTAGEWRLSPLFDVVPCAHRQLVVATNRYGARDPAIETAARSWPEFGLTRRVAEETLDAVMAAAGGFSPRIAEIGIRPDDLDTIRRLAPDAFNPPAVRLGAGLDTPS